MFHRFYSKFKFVYFDVYSRCSAENEIIILHITSRLSFNTHITTEMVSDRSLSEDVLAASKVYLSGFFSFSQLVSGKH